MSQLEKELAKHVNPHDGVRVLRSLLERANYAYEVLNAPILSDQEYDQAFARLALLEAENPWLRHSGSITERVGAPAQKPFVVVKHLRPMQSLTNTYSIEETVAWLEGLKEKLGDTTYPTLTAMHKYDGLAISLIYVDGVLNRAVTRGDGKEGEDVTHNVRLVSGVPSRIGLPAPVESVTDGEKPLFPRYPTYPGVYEVRGEVVMPRAAFLELNEKFLKKGDEPYATPRNAAAASMRVLNPRDIVGRELEFYPYAIYIGEDIGPSQRYELSGLAQWGFNRSYENTVDFNYDGTASLESLYSRLMAARETLPYDTDGTVLQVADIDKQALIPGTHRAPGYAIALKFPAERAITEITDVEWQVGRTGVITPVALLTPVAVGGVTVSRANLHNIGEIWRLRLFLGAKILVARAGDVIPKIIGLVHNDRDMMYGDKAINPPSICPCCGTDLVDTSKQPYRGWRGASVTDRIVYCPNQAGCRGQLVESITHLLSREALNVDGIGEATITALVDNGDIKNIGDIAGLTDANLLRAGCPSAREVASAGSIPVPFSAFLYGLGIRYIGLVTAENLAKTFRDLTALSEASALELSEVEGMGKASVESVLKYVTNTDNLEAAKKLEDYFKPTPVVTAEPPAPRPLRGETWVITGHLEHMDRVLAESVLKRLGATISDSIGKRTTRLVVGANPGAKLAKATGLGVPTMTEGEFHTFLRQYEMIDLGGLKVGFF